MLSIITDLSASVQEYICLVITLHYVYMLSDCAPKKMLSGEGFGLVFPGQVWCEVQNK